MFAKVSDTLLMPALVIATIVLATSAKAESPETATRIVRYADLDLATSQGAAELDRRIQRAAEMVCPAEGRSLADHERTAACRAKAVAESTAQARVAIAAAHGGARYAMNAAGPETVR
jgi:UrcA family protein